jgi:hypothetical protein
MKRKNEKRKRYIYIYIYIYIGEIADMLKFKVKRFFFQGKMVFLLRRNGSQRGMERKNEKKQNIYINTFILIVHLQHCSLSIDGTLIFILFF